MRKLIGTGSFSKAYQTGPDTVELVSTCPAKECYSLFSEGNPFAPVIERDFEKENTFQMPLYPKMKAPSKQLNPRGLAVYKALRSLPEGLNYHQFCFAVDKLAGLTEEEKEGLTSLAGDVCNAIDPQDVCFEVSPRNVSHTPEGDLVLLDCFFSLELMLAERDRQIERRRGFARSDYY